MADAYRQMDVPTNQVRIWILGSCEAVSEAAMLVWRSTKVLKQRASPQGIVRDTSAGDCAIRFDAEAVGGLGDTLAKQVSGYVPSAVVVTSTVECHSASRAPEGSCFWGASVYRGGMEIHKLTGAQRTGLPTPIQAAADNGAIPVGMIETLHTAILEAGRGFSRTGASPAPRWSLIAHAFDAEGPHGLAVAKSLAGSRQRLIEVLIEDLQAATKAGGASWADTLFFGSGASAERTDDVSPAPYSDADVSWWPQRWERLLAFLGDVQSPPETAALIKALADPKTTFFDGMSVPEFLAGLDVRSPDALAGLHKLAAGMNLPPGDARRIRVAGAPARSGYAPVAIDFASKVVGSYGLVASALRPSTADMETGLQILNAYRTIFGGLDKLPREVEESFRNGRPEFATAFEALQTEDAMGHAINSWTADRRAPVPAAVVTKKRRRMV